RCIHGTVAARLDFGKAGAGEDVAEAFTAAFVVAPEQTAFAGDHAGVAGAEQRRAPVARGKLRQLSDRGRAGVVDRDARGCRMRRAPGNAGVRQVGSAGLELDMIEVERE